MLKKRLLQALTLVPLLAVSQFSIAEQAADAVAPEEASGTEKKELGSRSEIYGRNRQSRG